MNRRDWLRRVAYGAAAAPLFTPPRSLMAQGSPAARSLRYIHLDVFTDRRLAGNQLHVYVNPEGLDADAMTRLTRESNFSENTFVFPAEQPGIDFRVRIFGQRGEISFAGHPTIGTAFALAHIGRIKAPRASLVFGLGAGPTPVDLEWKGNELAFAWMTQQQPTFGASTTDAAGIAGAPASQPGQDKRGPRVRTIVCGPAGSPRRRSTPTHGVAEKRTKRERTSTSGVSFSGVRSRRGEPVGPRTNTQGDFNDSLRTKPARTASWSMPFEKTA